MLGIDGMDRLAVEFIIHDKLFVAHGCGIAAQGGVGDGDIKRSVLRDQFLQQFGNILFAWSVDGLVGGFLDNKLMQGGIIVSWYPSGCGDGIFSGTGRKRFAEDDENGGAFVKMHLDVDGAVFHVIDGGGFAEACFGVPKLRQTAVDAESGGEISGDATGVRDEIPVASVVVATVQVADVKLLAIRGDDGEIRLDGNGFQNDLRRDAEEDAAFADCAGGLRLAVHVAPKLLRKSGLTIVGGGIVRESERTGGTVAEQDGCAVFGEFQDFRKQFRRRVFRVFDDQQRDGEAARQDDAAVLHNGGFDERPGIDAVAVVAVWQRGR